MKKNILLKILSFIIIISIFAICSCEEDQNEVGLPAGIFTTEVTEIMDNTANSGGSIVNNGGLNIIARGVCWGTSVNPTISNSHTIDGTGTGSFTSSITDLDASTLYYVRSYATNSKGTSYGNEISFTTLNGLPTAITTANITELNGNSARGGGYVGDDGGFAITARGVCWSTSANPTIVNSHTIDGNGTGDFTSSITGLDIKTTYHLRSYATNIKGTSYGNEITFTTLNGLPTGITTTEVTEITTTTTNSGGSIDGDGGFAITARGVCWSTSSNPTISDAHTTDGTGAGSFVSNITGLQSGTVYYVRAYATNSLGTEYANEISFTTDRPDITGQTGTLTDYDGNTYSWIGIGKQAWMAENLKTTHYADGIAIPLVTDNTIWANLGDNNTDDACCYYNNNANSQYGALYTWAAAMGDNAESSNNNPSGVQGVCPDGWHLPSDAEWKELEIFLGMSQAEADNTGYRGANEGSKLASNAGLWINGSLEANSEFGTSGFTGLPGGYREDDDGRFRVVGIGGYWWSTTEISSTNVYYRHLEYNSAQVARYDSNKSLGISVRCLKD